MQGQEEDHLLTNNSINWDEDQSQQNKSCIPSPDIWIYSWNSQEHEDNSFCSTGHHFHGISYSCRRLFRDVSFHIFLTADATESYPREKKKRRFFQKIFVVVVSICLSHSDKTPPLIPKKKYTLESLWSLI